MAGTAGARRATLRASEPRGLLVGEGGVEVVVGGVLIRGVAVGFGPELAHRRAGHAVAEAAAQEELAEPGAEGVEVGGGEGAEPLAPGLDGALLVALGLADGLYGLAGDALLPQLVAEGAGGARAEALAVLDPELGEVLVVEQAELLEAVEHLLHGLAVGGGLVGARGEQAATHLGAAARPRRQEADCGVEEGAVGLASAEPLDIGGGELHAGGQPLRDDDRLIQPEGEGAVEVEVVAVGAALLLLDLGDSHSAGLFRRGRLRPEAAGRDGRGARRGGPAE